MRKHLPLAMPNKSFVNSYRHVTLLWKAVFFKTKALLLVYLLHYLSFNNSLPNLLSLQEKTAKHILFHLCVERIHDTNAEESQPCFGVYVPFSFAVFHKVRIHSSYDKWQSLAIFKLSTFLWLFFKDLQDLLVSSLLHRNMWTVSFLLWKMSLFSYSTAPKSFARQG